jgi:hypothetical protein
MKKEKLAEMMGLNEDKEGEDSEENYPDLWDDSEEE